MAANFVALKPSYFVVPIISLGLLGIAWERQVPTLALIGLGLVLMATVFVAVHHAEVVALRVGEPFGSLILAVAVTVIEVGMIVVLLLEDPEGSANLPRDTVFAALMITTNGMVGAALLVKTLRRKVATFNPEGVGGALATLAVLSVMSFVLPSVTTSAPGQTYSDTQLTFAALASVLLYATFIGVQTIRHRDYFIPPVKPNQEQTERVHVAPPSPVLAWFSAVALLGSLIAVVGLAKVTSPLIKGVVTDLGLPVMVIAASIAVVVLLPEGISAVRAAYSGRTQTSLNLAYGSALASIGLTIPVIAVLSLLFGYNFNLGLGSTEIVLLVLTLFASGLTVVQGKATLLQAIIHLTIFGSFWMVVFTP